MNAPTIWVIIPAGFALFSFIFKNNRTFLTYFIGSLCGFLTILALTVRIDAVFPLGPLNVEITSTLEVVGRKFIIEDGDRFLLALFYGIGSVWFFGSRISGTNSFFIPNGLAMIAFLIAALAVQPFLYAALLIEIAVLLSIPMLMQPGDSVKQGVLRYLIFQTMAVPFVLLAGWGFEQAPISSNSQQLYFMATILLGLGFSFWLAIFPFYTWIPLISSEGQPYVAGFIFTTIPTTALFLLLDFYNKYSWLRDEPIFGTSLQLLGIIMVVSGGIWTAFQSSLTRLLGYIVIVETGFALIAFSLNSQVGWHVYVAAFLPRIISVAVCSLAVSVLIKQQLIPSLDNFKGEFYKQPFATSAFLIGWFSICGLPLLPGFPIRLTILTGMALESKNAAIWTAIGTIGLFLAGFRMIAVFFSRSESNKIKIHETTIQVILLSAGSLALFIIGIFPEIFLTSLKDLLAAYKNLL
jgi:formate hydrogenlyase subunit 3/multisubunit Na+/H+ antiporter MnhD subunit